MSVILILLIILNIKSFISCGRLDDLLTNLGKLKYFAVLIRNNSLIPKIVRDFCFFLFQIFIKIQNFQELIFS